MWPVIMGDCADITGSKETVVGPSCHVGTNRKGGSAEFERGGNEGGTGKRAIARVCVAATKMEVFGNVHVRGY